MTKPFHFLPTWTWLGPLFSIGLFLSFLFSSGIAPAEFTLSLAILAALALGIAVIASVHHAEVIAHRVGEPFGTLILAIAVTAIEVGLILILMLSGGAGVASLARDTVFSAIMITSNGVVGLCLWVGGLRHGEQGFQLQGASSLMSVLAALATLTLVLPSFTITTSGPTYSAGQLVFAGLASLGLYGVFVFVQTIRHREYFLPLHDVDAKIEDTHLTLPSNRLAWSCFGLLLISLVAVVGLAKLLAPSVERGVAAMGAPLSVVGTLIALLILLPETVAAVRAAQANRLQTSLNLALGSGLASIGLTIPAIVVLSLGLDIPLVLGLSPKDLVLLILTFLVGALTLGTGRTTMLQGAVHLVIFAAFVILSFIP